MIAHLTATVPQLPPFVHRRLPIRRVDFPAVDLSLFDRILESRTMKDMQFIPPSYSHEYGRDYLRNTAEPQPRRFNDLFPRPDCAEGKYLGRKRLPESLPWHGALLYESVSYLIERAGLDGLSKRFRRKGDVVDSI